VPSSTVISLARRSPCAIWCSCSTRSAPHTFDSGVSASSGWPRTGECVYSVQPRSSVAIATVAVLATPRSPIAIAISARCSTVRCIDACRGAVSLDRSRSLRQIWRNAPPLR
jgi:hypothetical protein